MSGVYTTTDEQLNIAWPADVCDASCPITMTYTPLGAPAGDTGYLTFANLAFRLTAVDCHTDPITTFSPALTLTVYYDHRPPAGMNEETMRLERWDAEAGQWVVMPTLSRDLTAHTMQVRLDHLSDFALLGTVGISETYLPLVLRGWGP